MYPVSFDGQNGVLGKPGNMSDDECAPLPVFRDGQQSVSCWQLTSAEMEQLNKTRRIYLSVLAGPSQPPVMLSTERPF